MKSPHIHPRAHPRKMENDNEAHQPSQNSVKTKIKSKRIHNTEEDVCRVTPEQAEKTIITSRKIKGLKILLNIKERISEKMWKTPGDFPVGKG